MVQYLEEIQGVATPNLSAEELVELEQLRIKYEKLKKLVNQNAAGGAQASQASAAAKKKKKVESSGSSSDSEVSSIFMGINDSMKMRAWSH